MEGVGKHGLLHHQHTAAGINAGGFASASSASSACLLGRLLFILLAEPHSQQRPD